MSGLVSSVTVRVKSYKADRLVNKLAGRLKKTFEVVAIANTQLTDGSGAEIEPDDIDFRLQAKLQVKAKVVTITKTGSSIQKHPYGFAVYSGYVIFEKKKYYLFAQKDEIYDNCFETFNDVAEILNTFDTVDEVIKFVKEAKILRENFDEVDEIFA